MAALVPGVVRGGWIGYSRTISAAGSRASIAPLRPFNGAHSWHRLPNPTLRGISRLLARNVPERGRGVWVRFLTAVTRLGEFRDASGMLRQLRLLTCRKATARRASWLRLAFFRNQLDQLQLLSALPEPNSILEPTSQWRRLGRICSLGRRCRAIRRHSVELLVSCFAAWNYSFLQTCSKWLPTSSRATH